MTRLLRPRRCGFQEIVEGSRQYRRQDKIGTTDTGASNELKAIEGERLEYRL